MKKIKMTLHSEPVQYHGGIVADVMANSIATSNYSQEETFLREVLQNSCDQRLEEFSSIHFEVAMQALTGRRLESLRKFFAGIDLDIDPLNFRSLMSRDKVEVLTVADGNTKGLSGKLDASEETQSNFAGFFYNVGRQDIDSSSGGSFGLGRTVLTSASEYSTVLVYSRFIEGSNIKSRFMGMAISGSYAVKGKRFTGRHWIGKATSSTSGEVSPFEGLEAEAIANDLGLYLSQKTGMIAMVLGNRLISKVGEQEITSEDRKAAVEVLQRAAYKYAWPHMIGSDTTRTVHFKFRFDDSVCAELHPLDIPVLSDYVRSYMALDKAHPPVKCQSIYFRSASTNEETGKLAWLHIPDDYSSNNHFIDEEIPRNAIALIRQANFVVKYLEVSQVSDGISTRGVFKVNPGYDSVFRKSEPVAHDDWIPSKLQLKSSARNPIRQTLESIRQTFREISRPKSTGISGSASIQISTSLGRLLGGMGLTGTSAPRSSVNKSSVVIGGSDSLRIFPASSPLIIESDPKNYRAEFRFKIEQEAPFTEPCELEFSAHAILDNGMIENNPPEGSSSPEIVGIYGDGENLNSLSTLKFEVDNFPREIKVIIKSPQGVASTCKVRKSI